MDYLQTLLDSSEIPVITALLLGLLTTISPCPLATHITAIGFISKDVNNRNQIFLNGIFYTLGRILSYSVLGAILITLLRNGSEMFFIQKAISRWSELLLAPALILIGLFMLFGDKLALPRWGFSATEKTERLRGNWGSMALGLLFALAFCPTSGLFYFGMLIPNVCHGKWRIFITRSICFRYRISDRSDSLGTGIQCGWYRKILQPHSGIPEMVQPGRSTDIYSYRYLLRTY